MHTKFGSGNIFLQRQYLPTKGSIHRHTSLPDISTAIHNPHVQIDLLAFSMFAGGGFDGSGDEFNKVLSTANARPHIKLGVVQFRTALVIRQFVDIYWSSIGSGGTNRGVVCRQIFMRSEFR